MSAPETLPTLVIGHRGSPRRALENTIDSFDLAEAEGADGIELDVRLTADGEAVVHHDVEALFEDRRVPLATVTAAELADTPLVRGPFRGVAPTLRDVLLRYARAGRLLLELKAGPSPRPGLLEHRVAALVVQLHLFGRVTILSFAPDILRRIRSLDERIETCLNFDGSAYRPAGRLWPDLPAGCRAIAPNVALASERLLADARSEGLRVHVWTVNEPETAKGLARWGAASVITDDPALVGPAVREVTGAKAPLEA